LSIGASTISSLIISYSGNMMSGKGWSVYFLLLHVVTHLTLGQEIDFYPGLSPLVLKRGQLELNSFNSLNLYPTPTNTVKNNYDVLANTEQLTYGLSSRVNIGVDFNYLNVRNTFSSSGETVQINYWMVAAGPRLRWTPIKSEKGKKWNLTLQHYVWFQLKNSLAGDESSYYFQSDNISDDPIWGNQIIYIRSLSEKSIFMAEGDFIIFPQGNYDASSPFFIPLTLYYSYSFNTRWLAFGLFSYSFDIRNVNWDEGSKYYLTGDSAKAGLGIQFNVSPVFFINTSYYFPITYNGIYGNALNYQSINLSVRWKLR